MTPVVDQQRKHWNAVAGGWAAWLDWTERNFRPVTGWCADAAGWMPGSRILDVACGSGYPALEAARRVRPGGSIVATDISTEMLAAASRRAEAEGLDNIEFIEMDAEGLTFDDASFDAVTNAYGLMFCPAMPRALSEARRVLKPGGHVALVTWAEPSRNPFFSVITAVAAPALSISPPGPEAPGPFRLSSPAALDRLLRDAGFLNTCVERVSTTFELESATDYLQVFSDVAWKTRTAALSETELAHLRNELTLAARPYMDKTSNRLRLPAVSLCASGRK